MALSKSEKLARVHARMVKRFDRVWPAQREERIQALSDRRFYIIAGAMWEGSLEQQFENLPKMELNKVAQSIMRIEGEYRQNRMTVRFRPEPGVQRRSKAADSAASTANSLYRADARRSAGSEALDNAFIEGVGGGMGGARIRAVAENPEDEEDERQRLCIEPIHDADTRLFFDDNAKLSTKADARWGILITPFSRDAYEEEYDDDPASWPIDITQREFDWSTPDFVFVAEYYELETVLTEMVVFTHINGTEERLAADELEDEDLRRLSAIGAIESRRYRAKLDRCHKYIANGAKVMEDCGRIPGTCIPLIPYYAQRQVVDGVERFRGHVRTSKDAQRLKNMLASKLAEISSGNIQERPIFTPEQINGHQTLWAEDNVKRNPYLLINPMVNKRTGEILPSGPVAYSKPPGIPPSLGALLELSEMDMRDMLGSQEQAEKIQSNVSEDTVLTVQQRLDQRTFIYMSNFQSFIERLAQVWLSAAKDIYVEDGRLVAGDDAEGEPQSIKLRSQVAGPAGAYLAGDLEGNKLDVVASFGPASSTRRAATVRQLRDVMAEIQDPALQSILSSAALMNMEGEGMEEFRPYFRKKLVAEGVLEPTDEERAEMDAAAKQKQDDPEATYLRSLAEQAVADAVKKRADTILSLAKAQEASAKAAAAAQGIERDDLNALTGVIDSTTKQLSGQPPSPAPSQSVSA